MRLLLIGGLAEGPDREMIQGAYEAVHPLKTVSCAYRRHPLATHNANASPWHKGWHLLPESNDTLQADLYTADVILFTYSTVAEEAFIQGKPVWQWKTSVSRASALREALRTQYGKGNVLPEFGHSTDLGEAICDFEKRPAWWYPSPEHIEFVREQLFYKTNGLAAQRIAEYLIAKHFRSHSHS